MTVSAPRFTAKALYGLRVRPIAKIQRNRSISTVTNAKLWYLKPLDVYQTEKPYHINLPADGLGGHPQSNEVSEEYGGIKIQDLRGNETNFTIDQNGFQVFKEARTAGEAFRDGDHSDVKRVKVEYYFQIEQMLKNRLGAHTVKVFAHDVRSAALPQGKITQMKLYADPPKNFTPRWAEQKLHLLFPAGEAHEILKHRWQILNVWRPLFGPLEDWPLALCDYNSIDPQRDLVPGDNIYTHMITETYNVYHNDSHRWYFVGDMQPDELLVFKSFESKADGGVAREGATMKASPVERKSSSELKIDVDLSDVQQHEITKIHMRKPQQNEKTRHIAHALPKNPLTHSIMSLNPRPGLDAQSPP